ncbi:MAG TPA: tetratricopeptide repeat protein [Desulfonatronum sp.]|nr:tetratricopeptide repeat protein [Desulfonatronum sp.]
MSTELIKARSSLAGIGTLLKQDKVLPAVLALHDALGLIVSTQLMKSERTEFESAVEKAVYKLNQDSNLRKVYPLLLNYTRGQEVELQAMLKELLAELQESLVNEARLLLVEREKQKQEGLAKGREMIAAGEYDPAAHFFDKMISFFHGDVDLIVDVGELFLEAGQFEKAFDYLLQCLHSKPESVHLLNRIGIGLRRMGKCEEAKECFRQAIGLAADDERLYFNLGRVYVDGCEWDKAVEAASKALDLNPELEQARKMRDYARQKQQA